MSYITQKSLKKEKKKPKLSNSEIIYLIKFPSYVTWFFHFQFFHSKVSKLQKISYDVTI